MFISFRSFSQQPNREKWKKKQNTNTLTQENVNRTRRFTRVCIFLLYHGSRLSRIHSNPNEELFQRRYIGVTERSFRFIYFLSKQTEGNEPKKQKTNTLTQENVNRTWRLTRVCRFLLHHGFRHSQIYYNPNEKLFQSRYIGVTERSLRFVHFLSHQTKRNEPKK